MTECSTCSTLDYKEFRLNNNKWSDSSAFQSLFVDEIRKVIGWEWNKPKSTNPNYPSVIVGTNFGMWNPSTAPSFFPIKYGDIKTWTVDVAWKYTKPPSGHNLSFDIYWMSSDFGTKYYNIMIWLQGDLRYGKDKIVNDGYNDYYYVHDSRDWPWDCFQLKNMPTKDGTIKVNIKKLIDTITASNFAGHNGWYVPDIQFGNETWNGSGRIEISKYDLEMNGNRIGLGGTSMCITPKCILKIV